MTSTASRADIRSLEEQVFSYKSEGASQKAISKALGISEWQVRTILRKKITNKVRGKLYEDIRLKKVKKTKSKTKTVIVLSDIHIPEHDQAALAIAVDYIRDTQPSYIVLNGDIMDMSKPSRFVNDPDDPTTLEDELAETRAFLRLLRKSCPKAIIYYIMGNHEFRLERYIYEKASALSSLPDLAIDRLLRLNETNITFIDDTNGWLNLGGVDIHHGSAVKKHSGDSARSHLLNEGRSVLIGHVHKLGVVYKTDRWGVHRAIENGHLSRPDPSYAGRCPNWQQGMTELTIDPGSNSVVAVRQHHINNGILIVGDTIYRT